MSAIIGIFDRKDAPVERPLVRGLTSFLTRCAPDGRDVWCDGPIGFGHALLRTTRESLNERQPAGLEGKFWITADVRLDSRDELKVALAKSGQKCSSVAADSDLILHSYAAWGSDCVQHLRGDFAFAVWDRARKTLFCARDHFGIKPFYYADLDSKFVFSSVLDCLRLHPEVTDTLNERAIADFLLFGMNCEIGTTPFRDLQRLPPAHTLTIAQDEFRLRRYWSAPLDGRIRYKHAREYVEHFNVLFHASVKDRVRTDSAAIFLSGGLDSGAIAAAARALSKNSAFPVDLKAFTVVHKLIPDRDTDFAEQTAKFLKIPLRFLATDDSQPFKGWLDGQWLWPEPCADPFFGTLFDQIEMVSQHSRVALSGEGGDNLMHFEISPYAKDLFRRKDWTRLIAETVQYASQRKHRFGPAIYRRIKNLFSGGRDPYPDWIAPDFTRRLGLKQRWDESFHLDGLARERHPIVPAAHGSLTLPNWAYLFEHENPGFTRLPVEVRYPFFDLRIVNFLLAIPPFPWFHEKTLLREAMVGHLPETVRRRPKTPFPGDPLAEWLKRQESSPPNEVVWCEEAIRYIHRDAVPPLNRLDAQGETSLAVRPLCLNFWLQSVQPVRYNLSAEAGMHKPLQRGTKKEYSSPKLIIYGTVQELTKKQGLSGNRDGGKLPRFRTHV